MESAGDPGEPIDNEGRPRSRGRNSGRPHARGRRLGDLARRQHGVVSIRQLQQLLGYSRVGVKRLVEGGRLHRIDYGVYAVGHADLSLHGECLAAVLAVGPGALLSYYSAGWLWGLWTGSPKPIHVTATVSRHHPTRKGLTRHRARNLDVEDRALVDRIPVTSVARTLLDLASKLPSDQLRRVLARAEDLKLFDLEAIDDVIERNRGHHGAKRLRFALATYERPIWSRSEFERRFVERLVAAGLPRPATGWNEVGHEIDVYWPDRRFGVELDSFATHGNREAFEADRERDLDFALARIETVRVTELQFHRDPATIVAGVEKLLARR